VSEPVYNAAGLVQISPSNTNPDLTNPKLRAKYEPNTANNGSPLTYFRTCSTDVFQGHSDALYAKQIGVKTVFVTDNQGAYGIGLAKYFTEKAKAIGLTVLGAAELDAHSIASSAQSLATSIAAKKPDLVFFGGEYGAVGGAEILADDLKKAGLTTTLYMGGDGIQYPDFIKGSSAGGAYGAYASQVGDNPLTDPNAQAFVKAENAMFHVQPGGYDTYGFDAANVIMRAFGRAVSSGKIKVGDKMTMSSRLVIARNVAATNDYHGATGKVGFDSNGDTRVHLFSMFKVVGKGSAAH
jgi:branched-chain amino acid transport system substrate-binding protein